MRLEYMDIKNKLRTEIICDVITQLIDDLKEKSKVYRKLTRKHKREYKKLFHDKLRNLKSTNSKEYWEIINNHSSSTLNNTEVIYI